MGPKAPLFCYKEKGMPQNHPLQAMLEPITTQLGYELVRIITIGQKNPTLQIMIDRLDGKNINVDDCVKVSRAVSEFMDEKDPIKDQYSLEVSSPGLDRPLTKIEHFKRFAGLEAKLETFNEVDKRKRFKGLLKNVNGNQISIDMDGTEYTIDFDNISKAKLVITDELLAMAEADQEVEI